MSYNTELTIDVTFHSHRDLTQYLAAAHIPLVAAPAPRDVAWAILAGLSEYAAGTLDGLRLVGRGTGRLLHGYPQLVGTLARHANGTITAIAEDGSRWQHQLNSGQVITFPDGASRLDPHLAPATLATRTSHGLDQVLTHPWIRDHPEELVLPAGNAPAGWLSLSGVQDVDGAGLIEAADETAR